MNPFPIDMVLSMYLIAAHISLRFSKIITTVVKMVIKLFPSHTCLDMDWPPLTEEVWKMESISPIV